MESDRDGGGSTHDSMNAKKNEKKKRRAKLNLDLRKTVESRLDYMIKYLELIKSRKSSFEDSVWQSILDKVKATQVFLTNSVSNTELELKVQELDKFMEAAVKAGPK